MKFSSLATEKSQRPGLQDLESVELNPQNRLMLEEARQHCHGEPATRNRKLAEATELLTLSQIAPAGRLVVNQLDLREHLRAIIQMQVPVACQPKENGEPVIFDQAVIGFTYPNEGFQRPLPGFAFFEVLLPRKVWLPQIRQPEQELCIAPQIPAGTRTSMLILRAYSALSLQSIQFDVNDPAGVFDAKIAQWWQANLHRVPLTTTALLEPTPSSE